MNSGFLNQPALTGSSSTVFWIFTTSTIVMVVASVGLMVRETLRLRTALPFVVWLSATLWLPNEPFVDTLLGFRYASDSQVVLFHLMDRTIPLEVIGVGAMFFLFPWAMYQAVLHGWSTKKIAVVGLVAGVIDWPLEWMAIHWNLFTYYGDNPSRIFGLPLTSMVQNCFLYALMAAVLLIVAPYLKGWRVLLFVPVIPGLYLTAAVLCTWPAYLALHAGASTAVFIGCALISAAMNAYIPLALLSIAAERVPKPEPVRELVPA